MAIPAMGSQLRATVAVIEEALLMVRQANNPVRQRAWFWRVK
jgi:hypothetical protein